MQVPPGERRFVLALLLLAAIVAMPHLVAMGSSAEDDIDQLRAELNETRRQLARAEQDRDDYKERLEEQTQVLYIVLLLLVFSYIFYYMVGRRQKVQLLELQRRAGITPGSPGPRPRRRRG